METNAVVLAVRNKKAVILASGGVFEEIRDQGFSVGQRIVWKGKHKSRGSLLRRGLLIAACLALIFTSSAFAAAKYLPWTVVSVALGETTIQYYVNARNEVLSAEAETGEGQAVLETAAAAPYEPLETAMERAISLLRTDAEPDAPVSVEIAPRFGDGNQAEEAVMEAGKRMETQLTVEKVPWQERGRPKEQPPKEQAPHSAPEEMNPQPPAEQEQAPMEEQALRPAQMAAPQQEPGREQAGPEPFGAASGPQDETEPPQPLAHPVSQDVPATAPDMQAPVSDPAPDAEGLFQGQPEPPVDMKKEEANTPSDFPIHQESEDRFPSQSFSGQPPMGEGNRDFGPPDMGGGNPGFSGPADMNGGGPGH